MKFLKKKYVYVPPCPKCGSFKTGFYVLGINPNQREIKRHLKNGEYIDFSFDVSDTNCFCIDCGISWFTPLKIKYLDKQELEEEKKKREINENCFCIADSFFEEDKERVLQEKKHRKHKILHKIVDKVNANPYIQGLKKGI